MLMNLLHNTRRILRENPNLKRAYEKLAKENMEMELVLEPEPKYHSRGKKSHYYPYTERQKADLQNEVRDAQYGVLEFHESEHAVDHEF